MIVRVIREGAELIGPFETTNELPAVGDTMRVRGYGSYKVIERTFHFEKERDGDRPEDVTLAVKEVSKSAPKAQSIPMRS